MRTVFKQRWWWSATEPSQYPSFESNNFIWTQWRRDPLVEELPTLKDAVVKLKQQQTSKIEEIAKKRNKLIFDLNEEMHTLQQEKTKTEKRIKEEQEAIELAAAEKKKEKKARKAAGKKSKRKAKSQKEVPEPQLQRTNSQVIRDIDKKIKDVEGRLKDEKEKSLKDKELTTKQERVVLYGKMEHNYHLSNKKALFWNMSQYYKALGRDPFEHLPLTFHIENGLSDREFVNFRKYFNGI